MRISRNRLDYSLCERKHGVLSGRLINLRIAQLLLFLYAKYKTAPLKRTGGFGDTESPTFAKHLSMTRD